MPWRTGALSKGAAWLLKASRCVQPAVMPQTGPCVFQDWMRGLRARAASKLPTVSARPMSISPAAKSCGSVATVEDDAVGVRPHDAIGAGADRPSLRDVEESEFADVAALPDMLRQHDEA